MALMISRFAPAGFKRAAFDAIVAEGTEPNDLLEPQFWAHVAAQVPPFSTITAIEETGRWFAEMIVIDAGRNWARVKMLRCLDLEADQDRPEEPPSGYAVEFKGPIHKWRVRREVDDAILAEGMSKADAQKWLASHLKVIA